MDIEQLKQKLSTGCNPNVAYDQFYQSCPYNSPPFRLPENGYYKYANTWPDWVRTLFNKQRKDS